MHAHRAPLAVELSVHVHAPWPTARMTEFPYPPNWAAKLHRLWTTELGYLWTVSTEIEKCIIGAVVLEVNKGGLLAYKSMQLIKHSVVDVLAGDRNPKFT